ncbi:MAG: sulfotransferase domain-containing protein [Lentisphaeria bacterium]|nr:sulfotransferase domain-containing protein [Lentisphaeria bacterium]NQZ66451.1 sulfotransferase domain-containing protein [Lentisphaeria bacterium]
MKETPLLLHIGLAKTATSTLQETIFLKHPQVHYLGKVVGSANKTKRKCLDDVSYKVLNPILWNLGKPMKTESTLSLFNESLLPSVSEGQVIVGSWEDLGHRTVEDHIEMLNRCKAIFGGCRIMIALRNPISLLPSLYLQNLREDFIEQNNYWMSSKSYADIEIWYRKRIARTQNPLLDYIDCIQSSIKELGRENVGIFLFEELHENPNDYYQSVCEFMDIDSKIGVSLAKDEHLHPRMSEDQLVYMREVQSSFLKRTRNSFSVCKSRRKALRAKKSGPPAKVVLTERLVQEVSDTCRDGHRWLVENLKLPLEKYGYPL